MISAKGCVVLMILAAAVVSSGCRPQPGSPLTQAAAAGQTDQVVALLEKGADPNAMTEREGWTPLMWAARNGHVDTVRALLARGAHPDLRDRRLHGWTALIHAVHTARHQTAVALIDGGANVNARTPHGLTALVMAAGYGNAELVRALLERGADPYAETDDGATALAVAVAGVPDIDKFTVGRCQTATVKALIEKAPDLRLKDNFLGRTALRVANWADCEEVVAMMQNRGPGF